MITYGSIFVTSLAIFTINLGNNAAAFPLGTPGTGLGFLPKYIEVGRPAFAPMGHVVMCDREPDLCTLRRGDGVVTASYHLGALLMTVNAELNRKITQVPDPKTDGLGDTWRVATTEGDCEDIALAKRERLIEAEVSPKALRLAVVRTPEGEGHAVLVVRTSNGDFVLDNRHDEVSHWATTDLIWIKIQSPENPRRWHAI